MTMLAMLPDWDRISIVEGEINAHEALSEINNVVYCMLKAEFENGGNVFPRVAHGFNFVQVCTSKCVQMITTFLFFYFYFLLSIVIISSVYQLNGTCPHVRALRHIVCRFLLY